LKLVEILRDALRSRESPVVLVETQSPFTALASLAVAGSGVPVYLWDPLDRLLVMRTDREGNIAWEEVGGDSLLSALPVSRVLQLLLSSDGPAVVVRSYVTEEVEARELERLAKTLLTRVESFEKGSKLVILTSDLYLFRESVAKLCITVQHLPPDEDEIREIFRMAGIEAGHELVAAVKGLTEDKITAILARAGGKADHRYFFAKKKEALVLSGLEIMEPKTGLDAIGGYRYLKDYVRRRLIPSIRSPELLAELGIAGDRPRGVLLYGLPGTGKTMFATALAAELGLPMVKLSPSQLFHGIVGESEKAVRRVVKVIEAMAPVVVFIDEADQLLTSRAEVSVGTDSGVTRRVVSALLEWLGSRERRSFVVFATNYARDIDPAFLRPGRIDAVIPVFLPDADARREIFRIHTRVLRRVPLEDVDWGPIVPTTDTIEDRVVRSTELWTGAEIEKMVVTAAWYALDAGSKRVRMEHVEQAIRDTGVDRHLRRRENEEFLNSLKYIENIDWNVLREGINESYRGSSVPDIARELLRKIAKEQQG
jgi:ATP-dependent 26S proteasome regulatory subunit